MPEPVAMVGGWMLAHKWMCLNWAICGVLWAVDPQIIAHNIWIVGGAVATTVFAIGESLSRVRVRWRAAGTGDARAKIDDLTGQVARLTSALAEAAAERKLLKDEAKVHNEQFIQLKRLDLMSQGIFRRETLPAVEPTTEATAHDRAD